MREINYYHRRAALFRVHGPAGDRIRADGLAAVRLKSLTYNTRVFVKLYVFYTYIKLWGVLYVFVDFFFPSFFLITFVGF